jgi:hypothetical protein
MDSKGITLQQVLYELINKINTINKDIIGDNEVCLYVRYHDSSFWQKFMLDDTNTHQIVALNQFVESGINEKVVCVPHACGDMFKATFKIYPPFGDIKNKYNAVYSYTNEFGKQTQFMVSYGGQIGYINRLLDN